MFMSALMAVVLAWLLIGEKNRYLFCPYKGWRCLSAKLEIFVQGNIGNTARIHPMDVCERDGPGRDS